MSPKQMLLGLKQLETPLNNLTLFLQFNYRKLFRKLCAKMTWNRDIKDISNPAPLPKLLLDSFCCHTTDYENQKQANLPPVSSGFQISENTGSHRCSFRTTFLVYIV